MEMAILDTVFWNNTLARWLASAATILLSIGFLMLACRLLATYLSRLSRHTATRVDDDLAAAIGGTRGLFIFIAGLYLGLRLVVLPPRLDSALASITLVAVFIQLGLWVQVLLLNALERQRERLKQESPSAVTTIGALGFISRVGLWALVLLVILDNFGVDITALVAGLGIGGIAVALAVQNILGDLFAALSIVLDKPFAVGDFLTVDELLGTVEDVGLKTTRLRSLSGEELIFSNSDLLNSRVRNYGRMYQRRVAFNIGVTYQTSRENLRRIPLIIREAVESQEKTRFDRSHFFEYGDFSLNFETVYFVLGPDYNLYMDIQQAINLFIHERFEDAGIEFAYPTQTVFLEGRQGVQ